VFSFGIIFNLQNSFVQKSSLPVCRIRHKPPRRANMFLMPLSLAHLSTWRTCFLVSPTLDKWSSTELVLLIAAASLKARGSSANSWLYWKCLLSHEQKNASTLRTFSLWNLLVPPYAFRVCCLGPVIMLNKRKIHGAISYIEQRTEFSPLCVSNINDPCDM
jgi:hypothetical protein